MAESKCASSALRYHPTILCIDDDPDITRSIQLILSGYDVTVLRECCGRLGIWDIYNKKPDLVITDLRMPEGDGQYLLEQLQTNSKTAQIPVIVLSGQRDAQLPGRLKHMGAASFLNKPVPRETLLAEIERFVPLVEKD
jgi:CheY-like chemotaxis protein